MSDIERVEQKINDHITRQEESNARVEASLDKISEAMVTFVGFQSRAEERQLADREWQRSVEKHQDKQDERIERHKSEFDQWKNDEFTPVRDGQRRNTLITNGVIGVGGTLLGALITTLFFLLRG